MSKFTLKKKIEDRLFIKATQRLRRKISTKEVIMFFLHNRGAIETLESRYNKEIDTIINTYLDKIK